ncbi:MAG: MBL fold metallo-hydrolase [Alphaproteobacteria bacterium]|nr:MBL fold metallo-hydrolase [Alphaproteobacteria bacterium]
MSGDTPEFSVRFWGVRGSIATADAATLRYGGNTSSLEVRCGARRVLLDAGTGIRYAGLAMLAEGKPIDADLLLTHTHLDHIVGLPFFAPFFVPGHRFRLHAGHLLPDYTIRQAITELMRAPFFPVPPEAFRADIAFCDFRAGETLDISPEIVIRTVALNHPNGATGYRIEFAGKSICYLTDTEHVIGRPDESILRLIAGTDIMIYDATYTDAEFPNHLHWGHSTWQEGARLANAAGVGTYVVFHHDPGHDDAMLDDIAAELRQTRPGSLLAREGLILRP